MRALHLFLVAAVLVSFALPLHAQLTPAVVKARTFGVSPNLVAADPADAYDVPFSGLPNCAKGGKVYLGVFGKFSRDASNGDATAWASSTFTFLSAPGGSTSTITMIDQQRAFFIPDMEGTYKIQLTATDNKGNGGTDTLAINVAKYVGVGTMLGGSATYPQCAMCHSAVATTWNQTAHATALERRLDEVGGHFNSNCLGCHTTGSTNPAAEGDGFLHLAKSSSWTFPTELKAGNWDSLKLVAPMLAHRAGIQCESCHGPGSAHGGPTGDNKIYSSASSETCKQCHDAPPYHRTLLEYENSAHSHSMDEGPELPEYMNRGSKTNVNSDCARCHTSAGYLDVFVKSANPPETSFSNAPYKDPAYVGCVTCHDPHSNANPSQLRKAKNQLCADCHSIRPSGQSGLHASHQGPMLKGEGGREFPGYSYPNSVHTNIADACAECHMAEPEDAQYNNKLGGHTFRVLYDNDTPDDATDDVLNNTGCKTCHTSGVTLTEMEETQTEIKALLDELKGYLKLRPDGRPRFPSDTALKTQLEIDVHWNYYFVNNDNSFGVHNFKYAEALLKASIDEMKKVNVEPVGGAVPNNYNLAQNFPNPFNPSTEIMFSVPKGTNVKLAAYDANGKRVNVLVDGFYQAGTYRVAWNGTTNTDTHVAPSGVYFYRIEAGNYRATKKMVLTK